MSGHQSRLDRAVREARNRPAAPARPTMPAHIVEFALVYLKVALYPAQATLLKVITLALDALTLEDRARIAVWCAGFTPDESGGSWTGGHGCPPDLLERMKTMAARGAPWFNQIVLVFGRRASKGYLTRILVAWAIWRMLAMDDVHAHYGIDPDKELSILVFGTKGDQAKRDQFADIRSLLTTKKCFAPYLGKHTTNWVSILTYEQLAAGARPGIDMGLIVVRACETTENAARGATVPILVLDEVSQLDGAGSTADGNRIWRGATPGTTQFRQDRMIILSSSPAEKTGPQYARYQEALAIDSDTGKAANPHICMIQAPSWELYRGWQQAHEVEAWPGGPRFGRLRRAMIEPDDDEVLQMLRTDPEDHAVEYLGQFRSARSAYLPLGLVIDMFGRFNGKFLSMRATAGLGTAHFIHVDPSLVGKNTAVAVGHVEEHDGVEHVVYDLLHVWKPSDFPDGRIDYEVIEDEIFGLIKAFGAQLVTFDQFNSAQIIQRLEGRVADANLPRPCAVVERTATATRNFEMAEIFKAAAGMGRIHLPDHPLARLELEYLQIDGKRIHAPTMGPVQTDDLADAIINVCYSALQEAAPVLFARLSDTRLRGSQPGGLRSIVNPDPDIAAKFSAAGGASRMPTTHNPARGINPNRQRHPGIGF